MNPITIIYNPQPGTLTTEAVDAIASYMSTGQKIQAVKQFKAAQGGSLKEAKDALDYLEQEVQMAFGKPSSARSRKMWIERLTKDWGPTAAPDPADELAELIANKVMAKLARALSTIA